jgi:hypothetical protein
MKDMAASVRARLLNKARNENRPYWELQQLFALERFLYRIGRSQHSQRFTLKGALLLTALSVTPTRATRDIDLLGRIDNDPEQVAEIMREICLVSVDDDGLVFDEDSVVATAIAADAEYNGVRVIFRGRLGAAVIPMQVDIGIGDAILGQPDERELPSMLGFPPPVMRCYPLESVIAEKLQVIASLGLVNSRLKDYYDIWIIARDRSFDSGPLGQAIRQTFAHRRTELVPNLQGLSSEFATLKARDWQAFLSRSRILDAPPTLDAVVAGILELTSPILELLLDGAQHGMKWPAGGPWT